MAAVRLPVGRQSRLPVLPEEEQQGLHHGVHPEPRQDGEDLTLTHVGMGSDVLRPQLERGDNPS